MLPSARPTRVRVEDEPRPAVTSIGVVVPAHNEEALLGDCLAAVRVAASRVAVPVRIMVVLDDCTDGTAGVCESAGVEVRAVAARNVGVARAAGFAEMMNGQIRGRWLSTTDADTTVDPDWLRGQMLLADSGADAVVGLVRVDDWAAHPRRTTRLYDELYAGGLGDSSTGLAHAHVHGANLGVRATAYEEVGGFEPVALHEDQRLVAALERMEGLQVVRTRGVVVTTSARTSFRATAGFGQLLLDLASPAPVLDATCPNISTSVANGETDSSRP